MLQDAGDTVDPGTGFILFAYVENGDKSVSTDLTNKVKTHVEEVYRILVEEKKMVPERLDRQNFFGGIID